VVERFSLDRSTESLALSAPEVTSLPSMLDLLIVLGLAALVLWAGLSLLQETDFYDEVMGHIRDEVFNWVTWALALMAVAALAAALYFVLT
jgi:hypothetical protein